MQGACLWDGSTCNTNVGSNYNAFNKFGSSNGYSQGGFGSNQGISYQEYGMGQSSDGFPNELEGMTFNQGNTVNVLSRAGICGDPLNLCQQSKTADTTQQGSLTKLAFKSSEEIPANYFCLFNFTGMYSSNWAVNVFYSPYDQNSEQKWEQILIKKKSWDAGGKSQSGKWETKCGNDDSFAYESSLFDSNGTVLYQSVDQMSLMLVNNYKRGEFDNEGDFYVTVVNIGPWGVFKYSMDKNPAGFIVAGLFLTCFCSVWCWGFCYKGVFQGCILGR